MDEEISKENREKQQKSFVIKAFYWAIIIAVVYVLLKYCLPVWLPFVIGGIIAAILNKPVNFVSRKTKIKRPYVCITFVVLFYAILAVLVGLLGSQVMQAIRSFALSLPTLMTDTLMPMLEPVIAVVKNLLANLPSNATATAASNTSDISSLLTQALSKGLSAASSTLLNVITGAATTVPDLFLKTVVTIIATAFISLDYDKIRDFFVRQIPEDKREVFRDFRSFFGDTLPKCIGAYIFIMTLTFTELTVGFLIFRIPHAVLLGVIIAIVDILPVLGTGTVLIPWAIVEFVIGDFTRGIEIALLYVAITIIRNSVEPKLVGKQMGLHPVVTFAGMLLGLKYGGLLGMFAVPLATAFVLDLNRKGIIKIFK